MTDDTVVFSIAGLGKMIGTAHQIAAEIARRGAELGIAASLAIAANPDAAVLAAQNFRGVTVIAPGQEAERLGPIPVDRLPIEPEMAETLGRWGIRTCADLAALPESGLAERLGAHGVYLRNLARGRVSRPLKIAPTPARYEERVEIEHPLWLLEPLLFLISGALTPLCRRATNKVSLRLELENKSTHLRVIELPVPTNDPKVLLKLLQLDLEAHPPAAAVQGFTLTLDPAESRVLQGGLFLPLMPEPEKLQVTLARIAGMVGKENVGSPELLDTYRPDAFRMLPWGKQLQPARENPQPALAIRLFRPALRARVLLASRRPHQVLATGVQGTVLTAAGPWRTSGDWWTHTAWDRDEWDIALNDGAFYRIFHEAESWFVDGVYD